MQTTMVVEAAAFVPGMDEIGVLKLTDLEPLRGKGIASRGQGIMS